MATTSANIAVGSAGFPWDGKDKSTWIHQRVTATTAKPLVGSTVYRIMNIPAGAYVERVAYRIVTKSNISSTVMTIRAKTPVSSARLITSASLATTAGKYAYISSTSGTAASQGKFFEVAGTIDIIAKSVGAANTVVIDVFAKLLDLNVNTTNDTDTIYPA